MLSPGLLAGGASVELRDRYLAPTNDCVAGSADRITAKLDAETAHRRIQVLAAHVVLADAGVAKHDLIIVARTCFRIATYHSGGLLLRLELSILGLESVGDGLHARCVAAVGHESLLAAALDCPLIFIKLVIVLRVVMSRIHFLLRLGSALDRINLWKELAAHHILARLIERARMARSYLPSEARGTRRRLLLLELGGADFRRHRVREHDRIADFARGVLGYLRVQLLRGGLILARLPFQLHLDSLALLIEVDVRYIAPVERQILLPHCV